MTSLSTIDINTRSNALLIELTEGPEDGELKFDTIREAMADVVLKAVSEIQTFQEENDGKIPDGFFDRYEAEIKSLSQ